VEQASRLKYLQLKKRNVKIKVFGEKLTHDCPIVKKFFLKAFFYV
jgi:hypothetical protein